MSQAATTRRFKANAHAALGDPNLQLGAHGPVAVHVFLLAAAEG